MCSRVHCLEAAEAARTVFSDTSSRPDLARPRASQVVTAHTSRKTIDTEYITHVALTSFFYAERRTNHIIHIQKRELLLQSAS